MNFTEPKDITPAHSAHWRRFVDISRRGKLSHSLLLVGSAYLSLESFSLQLARSILCPFEHPSRDPCQSCALARNKEHPDLQLVAPEKAGSGIKVEQIRDLQTSIYTSPQLGRSRVIIIQAAERMNHFAANALLKILEEPPAGVYFILLAEQLGTVLPTIISRCQLWRFSQPIIQNNCLTQVSQYHQESEYGKLAADLNKIIDDLLKLCKREYSACELAAKWIAYPFKELMGLLYLIYAEMIEGKLLKQYYTSVLDQVASHFQIASLFGLLDQICLITKNLNHNMNVNPLLALESLLIRTEQGCKNERRSPDH
ncbi:DNA polymerase III, delta' subunit [Legionella birminghamensis]|uniref:DNA polymerase III subunit delta' n=1 Tax=Legionella birminghamensis TaxID=28083 RepID=A0A378I985_9GAMM|nr:DNA polymerase III subunit delta' C-terminal domain-containing protein [Legionella birminghamensis]KTC74386.1 DNA polymerase III, delta' subunit [Legionella birminghamensis]STX31699.1 DNA polymerase III, delta' subunit [Legionella birminghamensis]